MVDEKKRKSVSPMTLASAATFAALAGFAVVYGVLPIGGNGVSQPTPNQVATAATASASNAAPADASAAATVLSSAVPATPKSLRVAMKSLQTGDMAKFVFKEPAVAPGSFSFQNADGATVSLADWKGKVVLLNLWATWCAPCLKEMPGLDRLRSEFASDNFDVVAISIDRGSAEKPKAFLARIKAKALEFYQDPTAKINAPLQVYGMPTTILFDPKGREVGRLVGPAEWDSDETKTFLRAVTGVIAKS